MNKQRIAIVGAGFYGLSIAIFFANKGFAVDVFESNSEAFLGASQINQARVHNGYHYPRSLQTGVRSSESYSKFLVHYSESISNRTKSIYLIGRGSKTSRIQFETFCNRINAPFKRIEKRDLSIIDWNNTVAGYEVEESFYNWIIIRDLLLNRIKKLNINIVFNTKINHVVENGSFVSLQSELNEYGPYAKCIATTYGQNFGHEIDYIFGSTTEVEVCEIVQISPSPELVDLSLTVIDGPFWSCTDFPSTKNHLLTHVRHTPHYRVKNVEMALQIIERKSDLSSKSELMIQDASKQVPAMLDSRVISSNWIPKVIQKNRMIDDGRPISISKSGRVIGLIGGKIDNIYDALQFLENEIL